MHITGRKRYQTLSRNKMPIFEENDSAGVNALKLNPLAYWTAKDVSNYMEYHDLPRHPIAALGYPSIGCQPCTSRVADNEDARAGRWRSFEKSECGIHYQNGKWVKARP